jgi:hypothetical protein
MSVSGCLVVALVASFGPAQAGTEQKELGGIASAFESRVVRVDGAGPAEGKEVVWEYVNHWDFPLVVEQFEQSCECLRGEADKHPVKPGDSGSVRAVFSAGPYRGLVRKSLHVRFVGHPDRVELVAEAMIPPTVLLSSHDLSWPAGSQDSKTVEVSAGSDAEFRITELRGVSGGAFEVSRDTLEAGRRYRLTIKPGSASAVTGTRCLQIHTDSPDPRDRLLALFLHTGVAEASRKASCGHDETVIPAASPSERKP